MYLESYNTIWHDNVTQEEKLILYKNMQLI